jgi:signal peptidase I
LAIECDVDVKGDSGQLSLDLVEGGVHYTCRIDVTTGEAVLSIMSNAGGPQSFVADDGTESQNPKATTKSHGAGSYSLRFSNCDDEILLWVNNRVVEFDGPTTYKPDENVKPKWSPDARGDLEPAGVSAKGVELAVTRLRLYRDAYYVAVTRASPHSEYDYLGQPPIAEVMTRPDLWTTTSLFDSRRDDAEFTMEENQFFPMGDNSPQSQDARIWSGKYMPYSRKDPEHYVERRLLTGKALLIYWPHGWRLPVPVLRRYGVVPNVKRMGLIR